MRLRWLQYTVWPLSVLAVTGRKPPAPCFSIADSSPHLPLFSSVHFDIQSCQKRSFLTTVLCIFLLYCQLYQLSSPPSNFSIRDLMLLSFGPTLGWLRCSCMAVAWCWIQCSVTSGCHCLHIFESGDGRKISICAEIRIFSFELRVFSGLKWRADETSTVITLNAYLWPWKILKMLLLWTDG